MSDDKPIGVRVQRPYATREEYLDAESDLLGRSHVTLLGAKPRAPGTLLRFEVVIDSGEPVIRAEGRVVEMRDVRGEPGLHVKLTRIDNRTKLTLDQAMARKKENLPRSPSQVDTRPPPPAESQPLLPSDSESEPIPMSMASPVVVAAAATEPNLPGSDPDLERPAPEAEPEPGPPPAVPEPDPASRPLPEPEPADEPVAPPEPVAVPDPDPIPQPVRAVEPAPERPTGPHDRNALLARLRSRLRHDA